MSTTVATNSTRNCNSKQQSNQKPGKNSPVFLIETNDTTAKEQINPASSISTSTSTSTGESKFQINIGTTVTPVCDSDSLNGSAAITTKPSSNFGHSDDLLDVMNSGSSTANQYTPLALVSNINKQMSQLIIDMYNPPASNSQNG